MFVQCWGVSEKWNHQICVGYDVDQVYKGWAGVCWTYKGEEAASSSSDGSKSLGSCTHQTGGLRAVDLMNSLYISTHLLCLLSLLGKENWKNTDIQPYLPFIGQTQAGLGSDSVSRRLNLLLRLSQVGSHSVLILRPSTVHGNSVLLVWVLPASLDWPVNLQRGS